MAIQINGNGTITGISVGGLPDGIVDTDMIANNAVTNTKRGPHAVLQVATGTTSTMTEITGGTGTWTDTHLSVDFTPTASSSKVLVLVNGSVQTGNTSSAAATVFRDSTNLGHSNYGLVQVHAGDGGGSSPSAMVVLDNPPGTATYTYKVKIMRVWAGAGGNTRFPASNNYELATLTLMEIAA